MKFFTVELQTNATVKFTRLVKAEDETQAKQKMLDLLAAIDSGLVTQEGTFGGKFSTSWFEVTEAPKVIHDFELTDIQVEADPEVENE